ncbi:MAG: hypothetical protein ABFD94_04240 [Armatimonadia bacterium]
MSERIKLYRPANGTEGDIFASQFCDRCEHEREWRHDDVSPCEIRNRTFMHGTNHPDYPQEWRLDAEGYPTCTAFVPEGEAVPQPRCAHTVDMFEQKAAEAEQLAASRTTDLPPKIVTVSTPS